MSTLDKTFLMIMNSLIGRYTLYFTTQWFNPQSTPLKNNLNFLLHWFNYQVQNMYNFLIQKDEVFTCSRVYHSYVRPLCDLNENGSIRIKLKKCIKLKKKQKCFKKLGQNAILDLMYIKSLTYMIPRSVAK